MRKALVALIVSASVLVMGGKTYRPDCKGPTNEAQAICINAKHPVKWVDVSPNGKPGFVYSCVWIDSGTPADCNE